MSFAGKILDNLRSMSDEDRKRSIVSLAYDAQGSDPDDLRSLVDIAIILRDCSHYDESETLCRRILDRDARYGFALYELAIVNAMRGRHVDALLSLETILASNASDVRALCFAARMSARISDLLIITFAWRMKLFQVIRMFLGFVTWPRSFGYFRPV